MRRTFDKKTQFATSAADYIETHEGGSEGVGMQTREPRETNNVCGHRAEGVTSAADYIETHESGSEDEDGMETRKLSETHLMYSCYDNCNLRKLGKWAATGVPTMNGVHSHVNINT